MLHHPLIADLDLEGRTGLEIGPLHNPIIGRDDAKVLYVDHATTEELHAKYLEHENVVDPVDVDIVWGDRPLRSGLDDNLGPGALVDFVVASHVIEHVPDLLGWLGQLSGCLRPGGVIALSVPDKRYCFDARRRVSDVAEVVEAHLAGRTRPPLGATFDFWTKHDQVDTAALWAGAAPPPPEPLRDADALARTRAAAASADYHDVHCWVFTPGSMLEILRRTAAMGLLPDLRLRSMRDTAPGSLEFYVVLERLPDGLDAEERGRQQLVSVDPARNPGVAAALAAGDQQAAAEAPRGFALSSKEQRAILAKRRLLEAVRRRIPRRA